MRAELKTAIAKHERIDAAFDKLAEEARPETARRELNAIYMMVKTLAELGWSIEAHPDGDTVFVEVSNGDMCWTSWE